MREREEIIMRKRAMGKRGKINMRMMEMKESRDI